MTIDLDEQQRILDWLASGKPLSRYCAQDGVASMREINRLRKRDPAFADEFALAQEEGHDILAEETLDIADEQPPVLASGGVDSGHVGWQRLRIEARMKLLSKISRRYGDKVQLSGGDTPITISDAERAAKVDAIMAAALERYSSRSTTTTEAASLGSQHLHDHVRGDWDDGS